MRLRMRVLHTADWHLGCQLEGRGRLPEQRDVLAEICGIAEQEAADLVLLAGDIFDSPNPPALAEDLFYETLERLTAGGRRAVVAVSGNHDSGERIAAPGPLAERHRIALFGLPGQVAVAARGPAWPQTGPGWVEVAVAGCPHTAVVAALPYPSESRLGTALGEALDEAELQPAYSERVRRLLTQAAAHFRPDTVNLVVTHLFVAGGQESGSERPIQLGGAYTVAPAAFPAGCQYAALGHLHRPQAVGGDPPIRYAGAPLAYSFAEAGQAKSVVVVDATPGSPAQVRTVPLSAGRQLVRWMAAGGVAEVLAQAEAGADAGAWIDLEVHVEAALRLEEIRALRQALPGLVNIRPVVRPPQDLPVAAGRSRLSTEDLFRLFYRGRRGGDPRASVVDLFLQLTGEDATA